MSTVWIDYEEVKQKVSMKEVLEVFGIAQQFEQRGSHLIGCCPLPNHVHGPRPNREQFKISRKDDRDCWYCFGDCKRGGSVVDFAQAMTGYSLTHTRLWFHENFGDRLTSQKPKERPSPAESRELEKETAHDETGWTSESPQAPSGPVDIPASDSSVKPLKPLRFRLNLDSTVAYLRDRKLTDDTIAHFGCGLASKGVMAGYVCFPIYRWPRQDGNENPVGYVGRLPTETFDEEHPRHKVPPGFLVSQSVQGLAEAMASTTDVPLVVVEGVFKTAWLYQHGVPSAISTLTSNVSDEQARLLIATGRPIVLCFDGHADAYEAMQRAAEKLSERTFVRIAKLPEGREPDDLSGDQLRDFLPYMF